MQVHWWSSSGILKITTVFLSCLKSDLKHGGLFFFFPFSRWEEWKEGGMKGCWTFLFGCMMEGNRTENLCNRSLGWLQRQENDAKPWLWKLSNCFSAAEKALPCSVKTVISAFPKSIVGFPEQRGGWLTPVVLLTKGGVGREGRGGSSYQGKYKICLGI